MPGFPAGQSAVAGRVTATAIEPIIAFRGFTAARSMLPPPRGVPVDKSGFPERRSEHALFLPMTAPDTHTQDDLLVLLPRLRRYARVLTADLLRADELVLETLTSASRWRSPPAPWPQLRHWLFAVMHRLHGEQSAQEPRKQPPPPGADYHAAAAQELPPPVTAPDRADADEMLERLSRLPVEQREMLVLVVLERLSYADIAALLDVPIETVMSRLRWARAGMRDIADR